MNLVEGWFHAPSDSGNGLLEAFFLVAISVVIVAAIHLIRPYFLRWLEWHVRELGKRESDGRFDT